MKIKRYLRYLLGLLFVAAGANHFFNPGLYYPLIPDYLIYPVFINYLSGALEMLFGAGLLTTRFSRLSAYGILGLLIAFIPAHIHHIRMDGCVSEQVCIPLWAAWIRLLFVHPLLIFWAWIYTGAAGRSTTGTVDT